MDNPKILYFDIETLPAIFAGWRLGKQDVRYDQILKRPVIMCISWAWGDGKVQHLKMDLKKYKYTSKDDDSDLEMLKAFHKEVEKADLVVGHNGKNFDISFLLSRMVKYKIPDFKPLLIDDTYLMTKSIGFISHKLDDLGDYLGHGSKLDHGHGMKWWMEIMQGSEATLNKMVKYCDGDVIRLRQIYKDLKPYGKSALNMSIWQERPEACPNCGQTHKRLIIRGYKLTRAGKYPTLQCPICMKYHQLGKNSINKKDLGVPSSEFPR